jgi:hypothetical protein
MINQGANMPVVGSDAAGRQHQRSIAFATIEPSRFRRARRTNDPLAGIDNTPRGRRIANLTRAFFALFPIRTTFVRRRTPSPQPNCV